MRRAALLLLLAAVAAAQDPAPLAPGLYAVLETSQGTITARLFDKFTPQAVAMFVGVALGTTAWRDPSGMLVKRPLYENITFHRVIRGEMIQSGDAGGTGKHDCGIRLRDEFLPGLRFDRSGKLAIANTGEADSGACQFFITDGPVPEWNGHYTIFGEVVSGQAVVSAIGRVPVRGEKPVDPVKLEHVTIRRIAGKTGRAQPGK